MRAGEANTFFAKDAVLHHHVESRAGAAAKPRLLGQAFQVDQIIRLCGPDDAGAADSAPIGTSVKGGVNVADHPSSYARVALRERLDCEIHYWGVAMFQPQSIPTLQVFEMVVSVIIDGLATQP